MTPTTIQSDRQRELVRALAAIPHLVLSMRHGAICGCNVHGRVLPLPMAWPADSTHALPPMTEELLAFLPESEPTRTQPAASAPEAPALAKARTGEPLVHLHVDWTRIRYLRIVTAPAPVSRLG